MIFTVPWTNIPSIEDQRTKVPVLDVFLRGMNRRRPKIERFIVDAGADISMAPRSLCERLGYSWELGTLIWLRGISPREECQVPGRIHAVDIEVRETKSLLSIPFCFADGDVSLILGREGFFDFFRITYDKPRELTTFELLTEE